MAKKVFVTVELDVDAWGNDPENEMPLSIVFTEGLSLESVKYLLECATLGIETPSSWNGPPSHEVANLGE